MEAGEFRHRVALQSPSYAQDPETGENVLTWITVATVWAAIRPLRAREFIAAQATQSQVTTEIFIRHRAVEPNWRVVHMVNGVAGTIYNIHGVMPDAMSGREHIKLSVSSGVNEGE
jgi:SPP1 family predicted phage head-tail adaptor